MLPLRRRARGRRGGGQEVREGERANVKKQRHLRRKGEARKREAGEKEKECETRRACKGEKQREGERERVRKGKRDSPSGTQGRAARRKKGNGRGE